MTVARPRTLDAALRVLDQLGDAKATVVAGGTDVMVEATLGHRAIGDVVAVRRVAELVQLSVEPDEVRVGAALPYADLTGPAGIPRAFAPVLWSAAATMGSTQIRNVGTLGGNVVTASPVGDSLCALLALDARATVASSGGLRSVPVAGLLAGDGGSTLASGELLVDLHWPAASGPQRFLKVCRRGAVSRSVVSVAMVAAADGAVRLVIGGCGPGPLRVPVAEQLAHGGFTGGDAFSADQAAAVADAVTAAITPVDDVSGSVSGSARYRRHAAAVLVQRALTGFGAERRAA